MMRKLSKLKVSDKKGFTLIELMIVIAIIGILSAIAIPNFLSYRKKGMDSAAATAAKDFYSLTMADFADTGRLTAYSYALPPAGFVENDKITYSTGTILIADNGEGSGTITFNHDDSATVYTLHGTNGTLSTS